MSGQHNDPLRVAMFNPDTDRRNRMSRTQLHRTSSATLTLRAVSARQNWRTSRTAISVEIIS